MQQSLEGQRMMLNMIWAAKCNYAHWERRQLMVMLRKLRSFMSIKIWKRWEQEQRRRWPEDMAGPRVAAPTILQMWLRKAKVWDSQPSQRALVETRVCKERLHQGMPQHAWQWRKEEDPHLISSKRLHWRKAIQVWVAGLVRGTAPSKAYQPPILGFKILSCQCQVYQLILKEILSLPQMSFFCSRDPYNNRIIMELSTQNLA